MQLAGEARNTMLFTQTKGSLSSFPNPALMRLSSILSSGLRREKQRFQHACDCPKTNKKGEKAGFPRFFQLT